MVTMPQAGLDNFVVTSSSICAIDGEQGKIQYRGIDINILAKQSCYAETAYLLWYGMLPTRKQLATFSGRLAAERSLGKPITTILTSLPGPLHPMEALRTAVSALASCDPDREGITQEGNISKSIRLLAKIPTVIAHLHRKRQRQEPVPPNPLLNHTENFLYMLRGERATSLEERVMDMAMILMADHELNASTFTARVTASTLSDLYSAVTAAIGALSGPLHGAANQRAMEMLLEIGDIGNVEPYINARLAAKKRIMGFGHRVYKNTVDPRVATLKEMLRKLCLQLGNYHLYQLAVAVASTVWEKKGLYPNVDFYAAPLLHMLGIPVDLFTTIFAASRVAGWTAHVMEQYENNRLIRPSSQYVGVQNRPYVPLEQRDRRWNESGQPSTGAKILKQIGERLGQERRSVLPNPALERL